MRIRAIWAQSSSGAIGLDGGMPWHLPEDLDHFKRMTSSEPVIMGRRTWDSLPERVRPLPGRANIVVTRDTGLDAPGAVVVDSVEAAVARARETSDAAWVIGGATIYDAAMDLLDEVHVTEIDLDVDGDVFAPVLGPEWERMPVDPGSAGWHVGRTGTRYRFVVYRRRSG